MKIEDRIKKKFISIAFKHYAKNFKKYQTSKKFFRKQKTKILKRLKFIAIGGNFTPLCCPDQYVAIVKIKKSCNRTSVKYLENNIQNCHNRKTGINNKYKNIIIILESPHKEEFNIPIRSKKNNKNNIKKQPLGPAVGTTGENFNKWFCETMLKSMIINRCKSGATQKKKSKIKSGIYNIILMNAIQYQCSLGERTDKFRDKIFSEMWNCKCVKNNFKRRLIKYKPNITINCCTNGEYSESQKDKYLKNIVKKEIIKIKGKIGLYMEGSHPSSAYFLEGFEIKSL